MKRFMIAAALTAAVGLGTANTADAQYVIQYAQGAPGGGIVTTRQVYGLGAYQTYNSYVSPWGIGRQNTYYTDVFGNTFGAARSYSPYVGTYSRGFYQPSPYLYPYALPSYYNFYRRW